MQLPIAILYDDEGFVTGIRYLEYMLDADKFLQSRVIERPAGDISFIRYDDIPYIGYIFRHTSGLTNLNKNGVIEKEFTQVIPPVNINTQGTIHTSKDEIFYLVDYKGNVVKTPFHKLSEMQANKEITLGNLNIAFVHTEYYSFPKDILVAPVCKLNNNLYSSQLDTQGMMLGYNKKPSKDFRLGFLPEGTTQALIPKGVVDIRHNCRIDKAPATLKSIFFKTRALYRMYMFLEDSELDSFVCPEYVLGDFSLCIKSVKNLTLPTYILPYGHTIVNSLWIDIAYYDADSIKLPNMLIEDLYITLGNSPNLKAFNIPIAYPLESSLLSRMAIELNSAPALREMNFTRFSTSPENGKLTSIKITVNSPDVTMNFGDLRVGKLFIYIPEGTKNSKILIKQANVDYLIVSRGEVKTLPSDIGKTLNLKAQDTRHLVRKFFDNNTITVDYI